MAGQIPLNRRASAKGGPEYFPTPPWATRALCLRLAQQFPLKKQTAWDPACGGGHMARPLAEFFRSVRASDLHDYRDEFPGHETGKDFLLDWPSEDAPVDWIVTNPPFVQAEAFLELMLERARVGVALFVKQQFLEGQGRYRKFFERRPPAAIFQFAERVPLVAGRLDPDADTNQAYIWVIWIKDRGARRAFRDLVPGPALGWVGISRAALERPGDYPAPAVDLAPAPLFDLVPE